MPERPVEPLSGPSWWTETHPERIAGLTIEQVRTLTALDELVDTMLRRVADDFCGDTRYRIDYNGAEHRKTGEACVFEVRAQGLHVGFVTIEPDGSMRFA